MSAKKRAVKVLYIEDREDIRRVFAGLMKLAVDFETEILLASDGREGVEMALREKPDIIFMVSAYVDQVERQEEAEAAGVALFMNKPFTTEELESTMRRVLGL